MPQFAPDSWASGVLPDKTAYLFTTVRKILTEAGREFPHSFGLFSRTTGPKVSIIADFEPWLRFARSLSPKLNYDV